MIVRYFTVHTGVKTTSANEVLGLSRFLRKQYGERYTVIVQLPGLKKKKNSPRRVDCEERNSIEIDISQPHQALNTQVRSCIFVYSLINKYASPNDMPTGRYKQTWKLNSPFGLKSKSKVPCLVYKVIYYLFIFKFIYSVYAHNIGLRTVFFFFII